jgi:hypothetical protein
MGLSRILRFGLAALLAGVVLSSPALALVSLDDGRNQVFVNSTLTIGYDSNIFANAVGGGDTSYSLTVGADYVRRAGWIGLNASVAVNATRYGKNTGENFQDPTFSAEFTKQTGRTTGSLTLSAARENRADLAANLRDVSWFYQADLNFKYPVIERYSIAGNLGYSYRNFTDNTFLVDLKSYSAGADLFYVFTTDRDLLAGYHFREEDTSLNNKNYEHSFTAGMTGKLFWRLNGSLRAGYMYLVPQGVGGGASSGAWTANGSVSWSFTKRFSVTGQLSKDFSTTSTNANVDSLSTSIRAQYAYSSKTTFASSTGWVDSRFLGPSGGGRHDDSWSWDASVQHTFNGHLNVSLTYLYFQNWSTIAYSAFVRNSVSLSLTSRF